PPAANQLPKLGHVRKLNVEGVLELKPTLILADEGTKDQASLGTLEEAGINILYVPSQATLNNAAKASELLAEHLPIEAEQVRAYAEKIAADSLKLVETLAGVTEPKPRVLFIYARGAKQVMVAGADTEAAAMISMAGGENAITSFTEFKPLTPEALVEAAPDVILMFESGLASLDGKDGLANIPGISQTPAFKNDRVIAMDGHYLLGFGPRAAQAANELAKNVDPSR
ncbi:MAG: ABC transporter substrate-binding protein, partial [Bacteroidota bacterium]